MLVKMRGVQLMKGMGAGKKVLTNSSGLIISVFTKMSDVKIEESGEEH